MVDLFNLVDKTRALLLNQIWGIKFSKRSDRMSEDFIEKFIAFSLNFQIQIERSGKQNH